MWKKIKSAYYKRKHKILMKNVNSILDEKKYVLKDTFIGDYWYAFLFLNNELVVLKKYAPQVVLEENRFFTKQKEIVSEEKKELLTVQTIDDMNNFESWETSKEQEALFILINKAHDKKSKASFALESSEYFIENMADFLSSRSSQLKLSCVDVKIGIDYFLDGRFSHIYIPDPEMDYSDAKNSALD